MTTRPDHAPYIHAVADHLKRAGFNVLSVGGHDWQPRGGHILLGAQDNWDSYEDRSADVLWDEETGWRCQWRGMTEELPMPMLASPGRVTAAIGWHPGPTPSDVDGADYADVRAEPGTAEFDAGLAAYVTEREYL